jgi:hypothetical protein
LELSARRAGADPQGDGDDCCSEEPSHPQTFNSCTKKNDTAMMT